MFDTLIRGGQVATEAGLLEVTLALRDGKVAAWLTPAEEADAADIVEAGGQIILPGLIDAHVHFRDPGLTHKEDFFTGTAAAAVGGVTTALVMPTDVPATLTVADFRAKRGIAAGRLHIDIGLQAAAVGPGDIACLASAGAVSIEVFLGDMPPHLLLRDTAALDAILTEAAAAGIIVGITPADDTIIAAAEAPLRHAGGDPLDFFRSRPPASEASGTARAIAAIGNGAIHLRQISCRDSLALVAQAAARGLPVSAETTPHYLLLDEEEIRLQGAFAKILPPLRGAADRAALWQAVRPGGAIAMIATDHAPHTQAEKQTGDIWSAPGGFPGVQTLLALMLHAVAEGRIDWADLVRLCCGAPARRFGLAPRKGSLSPGADADLVLVDPHRHAEIRDSDQLSRAGRTPFAGRHTTGWPLETWLRGQVVARDGRLAGGPRGVVVTR
ncbi:dihydroorotase [Humitalea sp. 24SJ18S-53]|uniref:dihydroorotase n=1 Tax=Humitalea sp. 24SJ18S-53 TaxID=3422307 RepID=UPI003D66C3AC